MNPEQAKALGEYIRRTRIERGLSANRLAAMSGLHLTSISRIENGAFHSGNPETLAKIANALEVELIDLYTLADIPLPEGLPTFTPYLRSKYTDLPEDALEKIERYATRLAKKHGVSLTGPAPGEDEAPNHDHQQVTKPSP